MSQNSPRKAGPKVHEPHPDLPDNQIHYLEIIFAFLHYFMYIIFSFFKSEVKFLGIKN